MMLLYMLIYIYMLTLLVVIQSKKSRFEKCNTSRPHVKMWEVQ